MGFAQKNTNMVVLPTLGPGIDSNYDTGPSVYARYASRSSHICGGLQGGLGVSIFIGNVLIVAVYGSDWSTTISVSHFVCSVSFMLAGISGIAAGFSKSSCPIITSMVMSIFSSVLALIGFIIWLLVALTLHVVEESTREDKYYSEIRNTLEKTVVERRLTIAVITLFMVVYFVEVAASIWSVSICCKTVCCGRHRMSPVLQQSYVPMQIPIAVVSAPGRPTQAGANNTVSQIVSFGPPDVY